MKDQIWISQEELQDAINEYLGYCRSCHELQGGVEPDACGYECNNCGAMDVCGVEYLLLGGDLALEEE